MNSARTLFMDEASRTSLRASLKSKLQKVNPWVKFKDDARSRIKRIQDLADEANREALLAVDQRQEHHLEHITSKLDAQARLSETTAYQQMIKSFGEWLAPVPVNDDLDGIKENRMQGSCEWLVEDRVFKDWETDVLYGTHKSDPLWISGAPGTGKTYLSSYLVDHFRQGGWTVGYFFCKSEDQTKKSAISVIRTWAWQLFYSLKEVPPTVFDFQAKGGVPSKAALVECLTQLASASACGVLLVDGLDECPLEDQQQILSVCQRLCKVIRIVVVSRPELHIKTFLQKLVTPWRDGQIQVTEDRNRRSIQRFILKGVDELSLLEDAEQKAQIIQKLAKGACGVFLWVRLMLEHMSGQFFVEDVMEALAEVPQGLPAMYGRTLDNIDQMPPKHTQAAYRILQWVLFALRPLKVSELRIAVAIEPGGKSIRQLQNFETLVLQLCKSFVEIETSSNTVRLVHASVRDYLLSTSESRKSIGYSAFDTSDANAYLAGSCLAYMSLDREYPYAEVTREANFNRFHQYLESNPFIEYSSVAWIRHIARVSKQASTDQSPTSFGTSPRAVVSWLQVIKALDMTPYPGLSLTKDLVDDLLICTEKEDTEEPWISYSNHVITSDGLQMLRFHLGGMVISRWRKFLCKSTLVRSLVPVIAIASYFDFLSVVQENMASKWSSKWSDDPFINYAHEEDILSVVARMNSMSTLEWLLDGGLALILAKKGIEKLPDHSNALRSALWDQIIDWQTGKPARTPNPFSWTDTQLSSAYDRTAVYSAAKRLLRAGASPTAKDYGGNNCLHELGHNMRDEESEIAMAQALFDHGADLDSINAHSETPIHLVAQRDVPGLASFFIHHHRKLQGSEATRYLINRRQEHFIDPALFHACSLKTSRVASVLLEGGARVDIKSMWNDRSILQVAVAGARNTIASLLEKGASPTAKDCNGNTALHDAARLDLQDEIKLLIRYGSPIDVINAADQTPIDVAIDHRSEKAVQTLLDLGAKVDAASSPTTGASVAESAILHRIRRHQTWSNYNPKEPQDIFHTCFLLRQASRNRIPGTTIRQILECAGYWLRTSAQRKETMTFNQHNCKEPYIRSVPIVGRKRAPVRKIIYTITSKDQGWSSYPADHGTIRGSYSWLETRRFSGSDQQAETTGPKVCHNIHAGKTFENKVCVWNADGALATDEDFSTQGAEWVALLKPGDSVLLMAIAHFPGWLNIVQDARIEVFSSVLPAK